MKRIYDRSPGSSSGGSPKEGVVQIHTAGETSLPPGATVTVKYQLLVDIEIYREVRSSPKKRLFERNDKI